MHSFVRCWRMVGWFLAFAGGGLGAAHAAGPLVINEFLASNTRFLADEDGSSEDWIEIRNVSSGTISAAGWTLTDDPDVPARWTLPATNIPAGGYLVVFASGKDRRVAGRPLHTNFKLSDEGEYLALIGPDRETIGTEFRPQYPPQAADIAFGPGPDGTGRFFNPPTPGQVNGSGFAARVADTKFSVDRGFFTVPFNLEITCESPGVEIRYTTNGTPPTATTGLVYAGPLRIGSTTVLRAAAFKAGWLPSNVDTHTYLFLADVIRQSPTGAAPPEWPATWGSNSRDYGMDPDVVNSTRYKDTILQDMQTLPSFCVSVHLPDLFNAQTGIYANPGQDGRSWERPMSLELVYPDGRKGFQANGGIRIRGGFSRSTSNPKHAFRFFFRGEYGDAKLRYPVFGEGAMDEFDGFDLRTFQNYSWSFQNDSRGTFIRDQFNRDVQLAMGSPAERGDYYHLYINGQYWGLYNTCERPEASYGAAYFGGEPEEYDVIKVEAGIYETLATDGTMAAWTQLYNLVKSAPVTDAMYRRLMGQNPDGSRNPAYPVYVDPVNLIDYMLVILFGGNLDAPISNFLGNSSPNNFFGVWNRVRQDRGFQWFVHDAEHTILDVNSDRTGPYSAGDSSVTKSNPQWLWQRLLNSPEFKVLAGDRAHRHLMNGGVLTPETGREIYMRRKNEIDRAVVAESARWGDAKRTTPFTRDDNWVPAVNQNLDFIARRAPIILSQLRSDGVYPGLAAPRFNQHGGVVNPGFALLMAPASPRIYYTLDGSDPRRPGGAVSASALVYQSPVTLAESVTVKSRAYDNGSWSALNEADFTVARTFTELLITEIHYHPAPSPDRDGDDFEFVELKNVGGETLDLSGVRFTNGISFRFPNGTRLAPGGFQVLVRNPDAFKARYPNARVDGTYVGALSNAGERLTLVHAAGAPIVSLAFDTRPPWPQSADGQGYSLVPVLPNSNPAPDDPAQWRASANVGGSPGADDPVSGLRTVVISEVMSHTDPPLVDVVELHNPNDVAVDLGGWWLTDDRNQPKKYRIPAGRSIPARGYLTLSELDFNRPINAPGAFTFSSYGDEAWIFSGDAAGNLTGFSDGFSFGASANAASFGRHTNSVGELGFPMQVRTTFDLPNAGPRIGPVVLNEVLYHPAPGEAEFVELRNISNEAVPLFDPLAPTNTWRVGGLGYTLPGGITLPPGGLAVITTVDPATFRARHGIPASVPVMGPASGVLQDGGELVTLERPDKPDVLADGSVFVPYYVVDAVRYNDRAPWPTGAGGTGSSLERREPVAYGDDPASWRASFGEASPGAASDANRAPLVDAGPDAEIEGSVFPMTLVLSGSGADDGLPVVPGRLGFRWTQVSGPGSVDFADDARTNTTVRLPGTGTFVLRLTADDGARSRSDEVTIVTKRPAEAGVLVAAGSEWRYLDDGTDQGIIWRQPGFNDAAWKRGPAKLGFGEGDERTTLSRTSGGRTTVTFYFRHRFVVPDPAVIQGLTLHLVRDDGAMVYLNGVLVMRSNMPEGDVTAATLASEVVGGGDESTFFPQTLDPTRLVAGTNVLAVEIHQQNASSSDVSFDLRLEAQVAASNRAPTVALGPDVGTSVGTALRLAGNYTDDGLPSPPGVARFQWTLESGPGTATFDAPTALSTTVRFVSPGVHRVRLTVHDGALAAFDEVLVTVGGDAYADWRARHFTAAELADPAISGDDADPDHDGQGNRSEYASGTHPRMATSVLAVKASRDADGRIRVGASVVQGRSYTLQRRARSDSGTWETVRHLDAATCDCDVEFVGPETADGAERYYRIVTPRLP